MPDWIDLVERRLGDEKMPLLDERSHLAVKKRHKKGPDVGPVHVGVGHHDDLMVAELFEAEIGLSGARA